MPRIIADLHIHSPYSRAVSKDMTMPNLDLWARKKGIQIMGTGDFTHPQWLKHLQANLVPAEPGLFQLKKPASATRFMLTTELSSIYTDAGATRRVHNLIFSPSFAAAETLISSLSKRGVNLKADGRPIMGLSARDLLNLVLTVDENNLFVPAHIWTPWFAVLGSKSGYNSITECFGDDTKYVYALETGLSSDPQMNWQLSGLDGFTLISNSDSHSLRRIGREANVFDIPAKDLSYFEIRRILKDKDRARFLFTVEYFPEEGKYHYDGHADHNLSFHPSYTPGDKRCPVCNRPLTIGVLSRVRELADRPDNYQDQGRIPGKHLVPLDEIIADCLNLKSVNSKKVLAIYARLIDNLPGGELSILLEAPLPAIAEYSLPSVGEAIKRVRAGRVSITPGYDGRYGQVSIFTQSEREEYAPSQTALF